MALERVGISRMTRLMPDKAVPPVVAAAGVGMATVPAFYETKTWSATVAILGMMVLICAAASYLIKAIKTIKEAIHAHKHAHIWDGQERRNNDQLQ